MIKCDLHHQKPAVCLNLTEKTLVCDECRLRCKELCVYLNHENFSQQLINKINLLAFSTSREFNINELRNMNSEGLINFYKSFDKSSLNSPFILQSSCCSRCGSQFSQTNESFIYNNFIVCECCIHNPQLMDSALKATPFFSLLSKCPCCSMCAEPFNLKQKYPYEFKCNHLICLACIQKLISTGAESKCPYCSLPDSLKSLRASKYLHHHLSRSQIACSRHKNLSSCLIESSSLKSYCSKCSQFAQGERFDLQNPKRNIYNFLIDAFYLTLPTENLQTQSNPSSLISNFESLSYQQMIDKLREIKDSNIHDSLNSTIPKGRFLDYSFTQPQGQDLSYLIRFFSVMPPADRNPNYALVTKPWVVSSKGNQAEAVVVSSNRPISLHGIIFAQKYNPGKAFIKKIKFVKGPSLAFKGSDLISEQVEILIDDLYQTILFERVEMIPNEKYTLAVIVTGNDDVILFRGNPFDLKEEMAGSDGAKFSFSEPEDPGKYEVNGQHDISGPILGLLYKTL